MQMGDRVFYMGESWIGNALQAEHPEGFEVKTLYPDSAVLKLPKGGVMLVMNLGSLFPVAHNV